MADVERRQETGGDGLRFHFLEIVPDYFRVLVSDGVYAV